MKPLSQDTATDPDIAEALRVVEIEIEGLRRLAGALDGAFVAALDALSATRGRVVVTGMGKSGHVARKVAATLASTGTPALYVHPGEASHGDLGMITADDCVIALSNSGETPELSDIVAHTRRHGDQADRGHRQGDQRPGARRRRQRWCWPACARPARSTSRPPRRPRR